MLNTAIIMGRLTANPELKSTGSGINVCSFTVAVDRRFKGQGEERQVDFIRCVAWRERAEFLSRYFRKGSMVAVQGSIQVRAYEDRNGNKREAFEIVAEQVDFTGEKRENNTADTPPPPNPTQTYTPGKPGYDGSPDDFEEITGDDGLPF